MQKRIRVDLIPETEAHNLAETFLDAVKRFYEDPRNEEKFREWQRQRESK